MKSEQLDKFIGKKVKVTFTDDNCCEGVLGKGYVCFNEKWIRKGYHLILHNNLYFNTLCFKKSHVKRIEEIP